MIPESQNILMAILSLLCIMLNTFPLFLVTKHCCLVSATPLLNPDEINEREWIGDSTFYASLKRTATTEILKNTDAWSVMLATLMKECPLGPLEPCSRGQ